MGVNEKYQKDLVSIIHKYLPGATIYLFGSRARGDHSSTSDIDLAVSGSAAIEYSVLMKILMDIDETTIPMRVDLVDLLTAPKALRDNILKEGVKWTN